MRNLRTILLCVALLTGAGVLRAASTPEVLLPSPVSYSLRSGVSSCGHVRVDIDGRSFRKAVKELPEFAREEAYRLTVGKRSVRIEALSETGVFRARKTLELLQALSDDGTIRCCTILDYPRFPHRGLMIDESRTFKGKAFLEKQLDAMALLKMNVLHLHLTDAAGWRIRIEACPALTERTAWRMGNTYAEWEAAGYPFSEEGNPAAYGGYYSAEDLREIVSYAAARHITVIPEIEMPGHSMEVNRACPELACRDVDGRRRAFSWDLCPGNEGTFRLLEAVLEEVLDIFPSRLIHIGGDEAVMEDWPACVNCRHRMEEEGMTDVRELQGYLMRRIEAWLRARGRTAVGWDEIVETGLPEDAVVMSWRGVSGGKAAAARGHDVIMSPTTHCYLNYYQDLIRKEPPATGELISLRHCYGFDPLGGIASGDTAHVLGLQANLWCELIQTPEHAEYMLYPRLFALAETGWTPSSGKDYDRFRVRARRLLDLFRSRGYRTFDMDTESERAQSRCFEAGTRNGYNYVLQDGGPTLSYDWDSGVRIIVSDTFGFRDMNGNGALDPFEDWRLPAAVRAADLQARLFHETINGIPSGVDPVAFFSSGDADNPFHAQP